MANSIAHDKNYTSTLDQVYQRASVSGCLNSGRRNLVSIERARADDAAGCSDHTYQFLHDAANRLYVAAVLHQKVDLARRVLDQ